MLCRQLVVTCYVADLLRRVVMSSAVSFFVSFHVYNSDYKVRSDRVIKSNLVYQYIIDLKF